MFIKNSYLKTSMKDIAEYCGLGVGTLYYYIRSKEEILSILNDISNAELKKFVQKNWSSLNKMPPTKAMVAGMEALLSYVDKYQDYTLFWYQEAKNWNPKQQRECLEIQSHLIDLYRQILQRGCDTHEFKISDVNLAAHNIVFLCDMWALRRFVLVGEDYTFEQFKKAQIDFVLARLTGNYY